MKYESTGLREVKTLVPKGQLQLAAIVNHKTRECRIEIRYCGPGKDGKHLLKVVKVFLVNPFDENDQSELIAKKFFQTCSPNQSEYL